MSSRSRSATATPSALAWYWAAERAQREVELRREQEHDERRLVADAAVDEPNADGHRHESDAQRGSELEDGTGKERDPQRPHRRLAVLLARLCDRRRLRFPPVVGAQRRQAADDVEEAGREHA